MIAVFKETHPGTALEGLIGDPLLTARSIYFPQEDPALTAQLNKVVLERGGTGLLMTVTLPHEDYVHKCKRTTSAVSKKKNDSPYALFEREKILAAANNLASTAAGQSLELKAITRLMGESTGIDEMSFAAMKQIFTYAPLRDALAGPEPALAEAIEIFGDYVDAFDRSGITRVERVAALQRFCELFDLVMPSSFHMRGYMPSFVAGLPSKVWLALRRNADSRLYMFAIFPDVDIIDRALGTFDLESGFSEVVRGAGQYKPYAATCMKIMGKIDYLCEVMRKDEKERGFLVGHGYRRATRSQYGGAAGTGTAQLDAWMAPRSEPNGRRAAPKGDTRRLKHALTTYALVARDFSKLKQQYWAKA